MSRQITELYQKFAMTAEERHSLASFYVRNAASSGALFCLLPD
jgi:hypothetical protein